MLALRKITNLSLLQDREVCIGLVAEYVEERFCHNFTKFDFYKRLCTLSQCKIGFEARSGNIAGVVASTISLGPLDHFSGDLAEGKMLDV